VLQLAANEAIPLARDHVDEISIKSDGRLDQRTIHSTKNGCHASSLGSHFMFSSLGED
jgi:hypothetical protein